LDYSKKSITFAASNNQYPTTMIVSRTLQPIIQSYFGKGKAILLVGARQVGKSTLFHMLTQSHEKTLWLNCDQEQVRNVLSQTSLSQLRLLIQDHTTIVIDEAQRVNNIGLTLKLIIENFENIQLLVTGSSALNLHDQLNEPLTGRKIEFHLYPISTEELYHSEGLINTQEKLHQRLLYGSYPDVLFGTLPAQRILQELADSYLYKDILEMEGIRKSQTLHKLLVALALQVGSEVSYNELSKTVGIDNKTIEKYIDILEKCYIIFKLPSFSRNLRNELTKSKKIYFYDLGIRNAIIQQFAPIELRQDIGALWENFFIAERLKFNHYHERTANMYFWRTDKQEIDYIEEINGQIHLFELKWNEHKQGTRIPNTFIDHYHPASTQVVTSRNYMNYLVEI